MDYSLFLVIEQLDNQKLAHKFESSVNSSNIMKEDNYLYERSFKEENLSYNNTDRKDLPRITFKSELREINFLAWDLKTP